MRSEILYMLGVIGVGFAVNYTLRALPFLLFAGRDRALPTWVERLGNVISPVIIACLIVYAYSGSQWRTPWPYVAGVVTVVLQLWKRNPLASILAGTVIYMLLVNCCGCATERTTIDLDASNPSIAFVGGKLYLNDMRTQVTVKELVQTLEDAGVPHARTIPIRINPDDANYRVARLMMASLARAGYHRVVLVTANVSETYTTGRKRSLPSGRKKTFSNGMVSRSED